MVTWEQAGDADFLARRRIRPEPTFVDGPGGTRHPSALAARAFTGLIRSGEALGRRLDAELRAAHGIGLHAYEVLLHLAAFSGGGTAAMSTLAAQAPLSQSRVSRLVAELDAAGLVQRSAGEADGRRIDVAITERGRAVLREAQHTHHEGLEHHFFGRLDWPDLVDLARVLAKLDLAAGEPARGQRAPPARNRAGPGTIGT